MQASGQSAAEELYWVVNAASIMEVTIVCDATAVFLLANRI
jgi:hypothetical protein